MGFNLNYRTSFWTLFFISLGGLLLLLANVIEEYKIWPSFLSQLAAIMMVSAVINYILEEYKMESIANRIEDVAILSNDISSSGLVAIPQDQDFSHNVNWNQYFEGVRELDLFVSYANSWRNNHISHFKKLAKRRNSSVSVILPDLEDSDVISELSRRYDYTVESGKVKEKIATAIKEYQYIFNEKTHAKFKIYLTKVTPVYSFYRFDRIGILATYKHKKERGGVPTLVFKEGGTLYDFLEKELKYLKNHSRLISDEEGN
ncbi:hypothetical protein SAMN05443144_12280 [Fodinibius roseus]|uniref:Uncharacterized protein n=1 Tax=Fodinibius roseus TaxID=1194090 RepID=A0A1M5I9L1_9BACT|nr:hypothetical protein [Fodinibius roseus]SHG24917.1 hypothetical protein SAMN05443144_12280 [Fodinibius roseus]